MNAVATSTPDLTGRVARCAYYGRPTRQHGRGRNECNYGQDKAPSCTCEQPSSRELPFFEFLGEGSREATDICKCGYHKEAHDKGRAEGCRTFTPKGPQQRDKFYCGCMGWD